jgi:hypothetical protein
VCSLCCMRFWLRDGRQLAWGVRQQTERYQNSATTTRLHVHVNGQLSWRCAHRPPTFEF